MISLLACSLCTCSPDDVFAFPPSIRPFPSRTLCRSLKVGVFERRRHPVNFRVLNSHTFCDQAPLSNRTAHLPGDFAGGRPERR
jgi:hypothetical protein